MTHATTTKLLVFIVLHVAVYLGPVRSLWAAMEQPQHVLLTRMSVTNWLFEVGDTCILMDGYITRIPQEAFSGVGFATATPTKPDEKVYIPHYWDGLFSSFFE